MSEALIVSAVRTPIGRANKGVLKDVRADDLAAIAVRAAVERVPQLDRSLIEDVILGCAFPEGEQGMNLARLVGALAGLPETAAGVTVNRFCASSLQAVNMAAQNLMLGLGDAYVAGGVENMSRVPMGGFNPSFNPRLVKPSEGEDVGASLSPASPGVMEYAYSSYIPMGITAENLAREYNISREAQDAFALRSHQRAIAATESGIFKREIVPVPLPNGSREGAGTGHYAAGQSNHHGRGRCATRHYGYRTGAGHEKGSAACWLAIKRYRHHRAKRGIRGPEPGG